jgi:hypothetical protein
MALPGLCADKVHLKLQSGFSDLNILKMRAASLAAIKGASKRRRAVFLQIPSDGDKTGVEIKTCSGREKPRRMTSRKA